MAIERLGSQPVQPQVDRTDATVEPRSSSAERAQNGQESDAVQLSAAAKGLAAATKAVADAPDVREDRVAALREAIDAGTYQVPYEALARKLLGQRVDE